MPVFHLTPTLAFPPVDMADESGVLAMGGDLSPERLLLAYESGIFPWFNDDDPVLWWSPPERMVLIPASLKTSKSMKKALRDQVFDITFDQDFEAVIRACAETSRPDQNGTWINEDMIEAYCLLHQMGYAHSVEARKGGKLVGGLYGISMGRAFFGESMFSHVSEASKIALHSLNAFAQKHEFRFIDCQIHTPHLAALGATEISRSEFQKHLKEALAYPDLQGKWQINA